MLNVATEAMVQIASNFNCLELLGSHCSDLGRRISSSCSEVMVHDVG